MVAATAGWVSLLVAAGLLLLGAVGELFNRHWARRVLALYVMAWLIGRVAAAGSQLAYHWEFWPNGGRKFVGLLAGHLGELLIEASYPVLLLICLSWKYTR